MSPLQVEPSPTLAFSARPLTPQVSPGFVVQLSWLSCGKLCSSQTSHLTPALLHKQPPSAPSAQRLSLPPSTFLEPKATSMCAEGGQGKQGGCEAPEETR